MQITIGNVRLLGTRPEEGAQNFQLVSESALQIVQAIGAAAAVPIPRGNKRVTLTFTVQRVHADAETAADFCVSYEAGFPAGGKVTVSTTRGERVFSSGVAAVIKATHTGATSTVDYRVVCGPAVVGSGGTGPGNVIAPNNVFF